MQKLRWLAISWLFGSGLDAQVLNEIMYHPREESAPGVEDKRLEWIELYNENADPVDLSGYTFTRGISFTFPLGTFMEGRSFLVVCANEAAVRSKYGITNTIGNWNSTTALDNSGEAVTLANVSGRVISTVSFNDRNRWPAGADGTGHSLALLTPFSEIDDAGSWALSPTLGGSPGGPNFGNQSTFKDSLLIADNETWKYLKGTLPSPADWNRTTFSDAVWASGQTGIGYEDGDDRTVLGDMLGNYLTVFCRKKFSVPDLASVKNLILSVSYDDGFVAYLNGTEVARSSVIGNPPSFDAVASANHEAGTFEDFDLTASKGLLVAGANNVLAVQVHNVSLTSTDLSFIPKLISREIVEPQAVATVPVVINEGFIRTTGERWIEIYNTSGSTVDLSGFHFTDDVRNLVKSTLPAGTSISGHGFKAFTDAELGLNFSLTAPAAREKVLVALVNAAGTRVVDAFAFKPLVDERSEARLPDGSGDMAPAADPTRGLGNAVTLVGGGNVVLNEIMYHPLSEDPNDEYLELYNRGQAAVGLAGFALEKAVDFAFPDVSIGAGEYLVVARNPERIAGRYGLAQSRVLGPWYRIREDSQGNQFQEPASLADSGERITLLDPNGNVADTVRYHDDGEWPFWADGRGSSLELIDPFQDGEVPQAWDASDDSAKSTPQVFTYTGRHAGGESELHFLLEDRGIAIVDDVSLALGNTEYVSNGDFEADTDGWKLEGTHVNSGWTGDPDLVIDGGGSLKVVATGGGDNKVNRIETYPDLFPALNTSSTYTISFTARWIVGSKRLLTRGYNHGLARSHELSVPSQLGTPGAVNGVTLRQGSRVGSANLGPVIDGVSHGPVVPGANEPVLVTARVQDSDGVQPGTVRISYALNVPPATSAGFSSVVMADAGGGIYTATIPGQLLGTRVLFFITAQDASPGRIGGRFPLDHLERTHPAVLDPAEAVPADARYAMYRHDAKLPSTPYHSYRFIAHQASIDYLWSRPIQSNDLIDGTFVFGSDRAYYGAHIRWAGSPWLRTAPSWGNSYRVRFSGDGLLHGSIRSFNLENHSTDGKERISHYLIRYQNATGIKVPYADPWYARWQINDQVNGVFEHVPQPDNDYIKAWYPGDDSGDFFEMDDRFEFNDSGSKVSNQDGRMTYPPYSNAVYPTPDPVQNYLNWRENYRFYLNVRANPSQDNFKNLIEFSKVLDASQTSAAAFDAAIYRYADVEAMLRVWAVRMNTDDWDTWGTSRGKNCYLYRRPSDGRWVLLPWDMELTYGNTASFPLGATPSTPIPISSLFPEVNRMLNRPLIKRRYYGVLKEMVDRQFNSDFLTPWMDLLAQNGTGSTGVGRPGGFIDQRAQLIRTWIAPAVFPQQRLLITTSQGNPFTTPNGSTDIAGDAPAEVYTILVLRNGTALSPQPDLQFSTTSMKGWSMKAIPLVSGLNHLEFLGYTSEGDVLIDSDTIDVTFSGNWDPPVLDGIVPTNGLAGIPIQLSGSDFHTGLKVYFGSMEATSVVFNEASDPTHITVTVPPALGSGPVEVKVANSDEQQSNLKTFTVLAAFVRGDGNLDGRVDLSDAVKILLVLYSGATTTCSDALDVDDSGTLETTDPIRILEYLFRGAGEPPAPFPNRGLDPTIGDELTCEEGL